MQWRKSKGCGGATIYELIDDTFIYAVVRRNGDWVIYVPSERRCIDETFDLLRHAKRRARHYIQERGSQTPTASGASAAPAQAAPSKAREQQP